MRRSELRDVLRGSAFRHLLGTRLVSQLADGVFNVALTSYVFFNPQKAATAADAAQLFAALLLPYSVVGPFAGALLDRWRRQRTLVVVNVVRAVLVLEVAALVAADVDGAAFYASALVAVSVNRFFLAGLSAALPHVVESRSLVMANSLSTTSGTLAAITGGGVGYLFKELLGGDATVVSIAAVGYVVAALIAARLPADLLGPDREPGEPIRGDAVSDIARGLVEGAGHVWERRPAAYALAAIAVHRFSYGISTIATILLYRNYFHDEGDTDAALAGLAAVFALSAAGVFTAAVLTPSVTHRISKERWIVVLLGTGVVAQLVFGLPFTEPALLGGAFVLGVVAQGVKICVDTIVQETVDDAHRGRVFAVYDVLFNVAFVGAAAVAAATVPMSGKSYPMLVTVAVGYALAAVGYAWAVAARSLAEEPRDGDRRVGREEVVQEVVDDVDQPTAGGG